MFSPKERERKLKSRIKIKQTSSKIMFWNWVYFWVDNQKQKPGKISQKSITTNTIKVYRTIAGSVFWKNGVDFVMNKIRIPWSIFTYNSTRRWLGRSCGSLYNTQHILANCKFEVFYQACVVRCEVRSWSGRITTFDGRRSPPQCKSGSQSVVDEVNKNTNAPNHANREGLPIG